MLVDSLLGCIPFLMTGNCSYVTVSVVCLLLVAFLMHELIF